MNAKVRSHDSDAVFFKIVTGVLQGDKQAPYELIMCLDDVDISNKRKWLSAKIPEARSRRYPAATISDED